MLAHQKEQITQVFQHAIAELIKDSGLTPNIVLERPRDAAHGDIACNIAMQIAKPLKKNPREIAQAVVADIAAQAHPLIASAEIAGPGFINLRLHASAKQGVVKTILEQTTAYGRGTQGQGKK